MPSETEESAGGFALVLVPNANARVQDLGRFRTGLQMETDILEASALVCRADDAWEMMPVAGKVRFAFEGNAYDAVNMEHFFGKLRCAAGRLVQNYPSIAYGVASVEDLTPVARFDLDRMVFDEILDAEALSAWAKEPIEAICPPRLPTPCDDPLVIKPLLDAEMAPVLTDPSSVMIWRLTNGQMLVGQPGAPRVCLWSIEDAGFREIIEGLPAGRLSEEVKRSIFGRAVPSSPSGPSF